MVVKLPSRIPFLLTLLVLAAAALGTPARATAQASATAPRPPVTIETPLFLGGAGEQFFVEAAREFERARPDVAVDMYLDPRMVDKVQVRILEGSYFDITNVLMNYWPVIRAGVAADMTAALDGPNWEGDAKWRDTFLPGSLDAYTTGDKTYGIPLGYYASVIWYNKKMFREHGWQTPVTWDEFFALCDKVKAAGVAPLAFQGRYPYYARGPFEAAYYHLGGPDMWRDRNLLEPGLHTNDVGVESIRLVRRMAGYFQRGALGMSHTESQLQFFLGHTAMIPCGAWLKSEMLGKIPDGFEMGCFNLPRAEPTKGEPTAVFAQVEPFIVFQTTPERTAAAIDFLRFVTSRKMAGRFAKLQDIPTAVRGANEGNLSADLADLTRVVAEAKVSFGLIPGEGYPELQQVYNDMMYDAIATNAPADQVARKFEQIAQSVRGQAENPDRYAVRHVWKPIALLFLLGGGAILFVVRSARDWRRRADARSRAAIADASLQRMGWGNVLLFVGPSVAIYTLFVILPSLRSFSWSLHQWNGLTDMGSMPFKGLLNFKRLLLESNDFWTAINNNLFLMVVVPLFVIPLAMFLAATISRGVWGAKLFRVVFFFPNLIGGVAATLLWMHLYNPKGGLINTALAGVGTGFAAIGLDAVAGWFQAFDGYAWLEPKNLYWSLIPISIWGTVGFNMVLYLAAMESIDESYYEAATLDGAGPVRQFFTITLPLIWEILAISLVFLIIGGMKAFEVIWLLTNQQPQTETHVITTRMVQTMFREYRVGEATALAVVLFLMVLIGSAAMLRGMRRDAVEG